MTEIDRDTVRCELMGVRDAEIRYQFLERYSPKLEEFVTHMVIAFSKWSDLDKEISKDISGAHISSLVYGALHTHVVAMKLLISGLQVPAGNSQRYVLESIATALLVSKPALGILARYANNEYSTTKAVRDVQRHAGKLGLNRSALEILSAQSKFYDLTSHPTLFASGSYITLTEGNHRTVLGGCFDEGKCFAYEKEISTRVSLASIFPNIIFGIRRNYIGAA